MKTKLLLGVLFFTCIFSSCKKDVADNTNTTDFEFTINSQNYKWYFQSDSVKSSLKGAMIKPSFNPNTNQACYELVGWDSASKINMWCFINTPTLALGRFNITTVLSHPYVNAVSEFNGEKYGAMTDDVISVTLTKISGKYASGYFSVVMHDLRTSSKELRIYNGYFNNILIRD